VQVDHTAIHVGCLEMATSILISLNRQGDAEDILKKELPADGTDPRVYDLLGQLYEVQQKNLLALGTFHEAAKRYPETAYFRDKEAQCAERQGQQHPQGAPPDMGRDAGGAPGAAGMETPQGSPANETDLLQEADGFLAGQAYPEAGRGYIRALELNPRSFRAFNGLGLVAWYLGKHSEAYNLFLKAVEINPGDEDLLLNLWDAAQKTGHAEEGRAILAEAVSGHPGLTRVEKL
jgi:tetratricopeptide (TPR) repeat protein